MNPTEENSSQARNLLRIDKDFARNPTVFRIFKENERLVKSFVIFAYWKYKRGEFNMFNQLRLDMMEFCKEMSYDRNTLRHVVDAPLQLSGLGKSEIQKLRDKKVFIYENKGEDALYSMLTTNLIFDSAVGETKDHFFVKKSQISLLKELTFYVDKSNRDKRYYDLTFNTDFFDMMNNYFTHINKDYFIETRNSNLSDLYLYLVDIQEICSSKNLLVFENCEFDLLCKLAGIGSEIEPKYKKRHLKSKFARLTTIVKDLHMSLKFAPQGKYDYKPLLVYHKTIKVDEQKNKAIAINEEKLLYCAGEVMLKIKSLFFTKYPEYAKEGIEYGDMKYQEWVNNLAIDNDVKVNVFLDTLNKFFPKSKAYINDLMLKNPAKATEMFKQASKGLPFSSAGLF